MKKQYKLPLILLALTSCAKHDADFAAQENAALDNHGVVIAKSEFIGGRYATETDGTTSDCEGGVGIGISVESAASDSSYIFNRKQQPCKEAAIIFDGTQDLYARAADPSIDIIFNDKYGKLPNTHNIEKTAQTATVLSDSATGYSVNDDLATKPYGQMGMLKVDYDAIKADNDKNLQQQRFEEILKENINSSKEHVLAQARAEKRLDDNEEKQELIFANKDLSAKQNAVSRYAEKLSENLVSKQGEIIDLESEVNQLKLLKQVQANNYEQKVAMLEKRVEDFAQLSLELKRQNEKLALLAQQANKTIATDLTEAENDAENARYVAMLNMAQDIQTDEKLAKALEVSQKRAMQRKAQRLQTQADTLAHHAASDKVFNKDMDGVIQDLQKNMSPAYEGKIARVVGVDINKEPTLADVHLLLAENNRSVSEILTEILADVQPMVGTWKLDWKLASHNLQIKDEAWNVTAETTLYEFFDYIKQRVNEIHGVELSIEQYPETRKIVITDKF